MRICPNATKGEGKTYDADRSAKALGWQVVAEASLHNTVGTVSASNATPNDTELRAVLHSLCTVDIRDTFAEVELSILGGLDTFELNERDIGVLVALGTLVTQNTALAVQTVIPIHPSIRPSIRLLPCPFFLHSLTYRAVIL